MEKRGNLAATLQMDWPIEFRYGGRRCSRSDFAAHGRFAGLLTQAAVVDSFPVWHRSIGSGSRLVLG